MRLCVPSSLGLDFSGVPSPSTLSSPPLSSHTSVSRASRIPFPHHALVQACEVNRCNGLLCRISEVGGGLVELRGALAHLENEKMRQELWLKERLVMGHL